MYIGIDLGSTNIKAAIYDKNLKLIDRRSYPVEYIREGGFVEFDADQYFRGLTGLLEVMLKENGIHEVCEIAFTGQAESLICLDDKDQLLLNAISWMDERSPEESAALSAIFPSQDVARITGQLSICPTQPATKILWLKNNRPELFEKIACYMMIKDYIVFRLTGVKAADMSIATFTLYFDIYEKCYWKEMLDAIGITENQLPPLVEPNTFTGNLLPELTAQFGLTGPAKINCGTLDHFAGMIGTGNITTGNITLSTGTVMAMAVMSKEPVNKDCGIAMHYGFLPDTHVMLSVAESGGVSLEWFRRNLMNGMDYDEMNRKMDEQGENNLLFLPYLVGTNAPEMDSRATGVFWGLRQEHNCVDMARAVMEGVSFVLRKNTDAIAAAGTVPTSIIATGGGSKSALWCRMHANATKLPVRIPAEKEAACLGAAIIAAVEDGAFASYKEACDSCVSFTKEYLPEASEETEKKFRRFEKLYAAAVEI